MAGKRGGARPGAGRPRGSKDPQTIARERAAAKLMQRRERSAERLLELVWMEAESDIRKLYDKHGNHIPPHKLSEAAAQMIAGAETIIKNAKAGDGKTDEVLKWKLKDVTKAKELLMRHYRLLADVKIEETPEDWDKWVADLKSARDRGEDGQPSPRRRQKG